MITVVISFDQEYLKINQNSKFNKKTFMCKSENWHLCELLEFEGIRTKELGYDNYRERERDLSSKSRNKSFI
ncbi:hypothetical protein BpHYR1_000582 [Brachionus plicatilis]|uniref:Uncharacterized protein n=1 Tax=Brachionus plicatilis TaxID=10195 RepID=A0A3M7T4R8_BRAPC|nr:hypothetical protein BpHYR1_000582 [Brachionus plicatilis]